jgi:hypothetical protein
MEYTFSVAQEAPGKHLSNLFSTVRQVLCVLAPKYLKRLPPTRDSAPVQAEAPPGMPG